ncbi:MAG: DUF2232 domain-containing protein [Spirochaetales bacterium]|nr:DUF2232 domain-containing protein [Spirochaetales bacterium]
MDFRRWRSEWGDLLVTSVVSFILYQFNMVVLFCIPLQVLLIRKDERHLLYAGLSVMATIVIAGFIRSAPIEDTLLKRGLLLTQIAIPAFILGGFTAANLSWKIRLRPLYRVLLVSLAAGIVSIPIIYFLGRSGGYSQFLRGQVESIARLFQLSIEGSEAGGATVDVDYLTGYITEMLLRNYLFVYFLSVAGSIWAGRKIAGRISGIRAPGLREFRLPDKMIWPLLGAWALVLVDYLVGIGAVAYAAWNIGSLMLFVYGMQGIGIVQTLLDRRNASKYLRVLLVAGIAVLIIWPGVNLVILIGLPVLGVSELWIHFRKEQKE